MAITPLPDAPLTTDTPQQFNAKAFAWVQALGTFVTEANAQADSVDSQVLIAEDWASKTDGNVESTDYSAKAWAIGGTGVTDTATRGASKEWAIETSSTVDGTEYSSKEYAVGTQTRGTTGSSKDWAIYTSGTVDASEYSSKEYAVGTQIRGSTGSAKDWAQYTGGTVDGTNYSAKYWATEAASSAGNAEASELQAGIYAGNAEDALTAALAAQGAAESARDTTLAAYDQFDDRYLGTKSSDPSVDNDGNPLVAGALYFNDVDEIMKLYTGSAWVAAYVSGGGFLLATNNLSDVTNAATARQNLDLEIGVDVQAYDSNLQSFVTTFTLPTVDGIAGQVLSTNGSGALSFSTVTSPADVLKPTNVSPADQDTDIFETPTLTGSTYYSLYGKTQKSSQWQISTSSGFGTTVYDSNEVLAVGVTHAVPSGNLQVSTTYYWRVRYRDVDDTWSDWSTPTEFDTAAEFNNFIATPTSTPSIGASFEGGFYTGLIWNEVTQSATSSAIGTGSKTFTVTDAAPLFYSGQAVEVRSRANPSTARMKGTVTSSGGTVLIVNVTSVDGSGTFTDWSIMAKYRIIVAPKSSGENSSKQYKNANTAAPSATGTLTEGLKATLAMVAADTSTVYPAAHFCNDLSIGGYSDWYLPARDELELIFRNLKPITTNNYTTADRFTLATIDYKNLGSLGDTAGTHGLNNNSDPQGVAYTTTVPGQTSVAVFQSGGAEAMANVSVSPYWSSTEYNSSRAWYQLYGTVEPGSQLSVSKSASYYVRAVRRSII